MPRTSFARSVARAAASGGSRNYKGRRPVGWYTLMLLVVVVGLALLVYSRNERNAPTSSSSATAAGPTGSSHWSAALGIDVCGKVQPSLPASINLTTAGIRTFGNGLIDIDPGAVSNSAAFEGAKATLGLFANSYVGFHLTDTSIGMPAKHAKIWKNGMTCTGPLHGKGQLVARVWSSPTSSSALVTKDITGIKLRNGQMITLAFVPNGARIPEPPSKATLISTVAANAKLGSIATTTTLPSATPTPSSSSPTATTPTATTPTATAPSTTAPGSTGTTAASSKGTKTGAVVAPSTTTANSTSSSAAKTKG